MCILPDVFKSTIDQFKSNQPLSVYYSFWFYSAEWSDGKGGGGKQKNFGGRIKTLTGPHHLAVSVIQWPDETVINEA